MEILRQSLPSTEALTGKNKEQILQELFVQILKKNDAFRNESESIVLGEGRSVLVNTHFWTEASSGPEEKSTTVEIGEDLKITNYGVLITPSTTSLLGGWRIDNKTPTTFDVKYSDDAGTKHFSWMVVY